MEVGDALLRIGGYGAIGALVGRALDLAMQREKAKLYNWLTGWWDRFDDVNLRNFGRIEAELVIGFLDRTLGKTLWSARRWTRCSLVVLFLYLSSLPNAGRTALRIQENEEIQKTGAVTSALSLWDSLIYFGRAVLEWDWLLLLLVMVASFALSISLTRYIATVVVKLSTSKLRTVCAFTLLLVVHLLLFRYWSTALDIVQTGLHNFPVRWIRYGLVEAIDDALSTMKRSYETGSRIWTMPSHGVADPALTTNFLNYSYQSLKNTLDFVTNGGRVAFALLFLLSYMFRPLIQVPILRIWEGILNEGPSTHLFAKIFAGIGVIATFIVLTTSK